MTTPSLFAHVTDDSANLIPGALLHGRTDTPDGAPVYGRLDPNGAMYLYTDCTSHGYGLKDLTTLVTQGHAGVGAAGPYHYTGAAEIVAWARVRARETHRQDADCAAFLSDDGTCCIACGTIHAEDPEPCCGARAFHQPGCVSAMPLGSRTVRVVVYRVSQPARVEAMPATLEAMQLLVGGYVEGMTLVDGRLYCNEEGLLAGLPPNPRRILGAPPICGDFFVTAHENADGDLVDLDDETIARLLADDARRPGDCELAP